MRPESGNPKYIAVPPPARFLDLGEVFRDFFQSSETAKRLRLASRARLCRRKPTTYVDEEESNRGSSIVRQLPRSRLGKRCASLWESRYLPRSWIRSFRLKVGRWVFVCWVLYALHEYKGFVYIQKIGGYIAGMRCEMQWGLDCTLRKAVAIQFAYRLLRALCHVAIRCLLCPAF